MSCRTGNPSRFWILKNIPFGSQVNSTGLNDWTAPWNRKVRQTSTRLAVLTWDAKLCPCWGRRRLLCCWGKERRFDWRADKERERWNQIFCHDLEKNPYFTRLEQRPREAHFVDGHKSNTFTFGLNISVKDSLSRFACVDELSCTFLTRPSDSNYSGIGSCLRVLLGLEPGSQISNVALQEPAKLECQMRFRSGFAIQGLAVRASEQSAVPRRNQFHERSGRRSCRGTGTSKSPSRVNLCIGVASELNQGRLHQHLLPMTTVHTKAPLDIDFHKWQSQDSWALITHCFLPFRFNNLRGSNYGLMLFKDSLDCCTRD